MKKKFITFAMSLTIFLSACAVGNPNEDSNVNTVPSTVDQHSSTNITSVPQMAIIGLQTEPATLDPSLNTSLAGSRVITNMFEALFRDVDGELRPAAAESVTISDDGLIYTFTLREANWSDGVPVTAHDFVFSFRRSVDPFSSASSSNTLDPIVNAETIRQSIPNPDGTLSDIYGNVLLREDGEFLSIEDLGIHALDDRTLIITLRQPTPFFLGMTDHSMLVPQREDIIGDDITGEWASDPTRIVTNGPFILTQHSMGEHFILERNPEYWDRDNVVLDQIMFRFITDPSTSLTAFRAGDLHFTEGFPSEEANALIRSGEAQVFEQFGVSFYVINNEIEGILQDRNVRRALSLAIDRQDIAYLVGGGVQVATGLVPYGVLSPEGVDFRQASGSHGLTPAAQTELALELLGEAGLEIVDGRVQDFPVFEILLNTGANHELLAQIIQDNWNEIGINVTIRVQENTVFQESRRALNYNGFARHGWTAQFIDPQAFMVLFRTDNPFTDTGIQNQELHDAIVYASAISEPQARFDAWIEAERLLMEDGTVIPIHFLSSAALVSESLRNFHTNAVGRLVLKYAYIAE